MSGFYAVAAMNEKQVMVMRHNPKKKYFLISARLKEQVGALADITKILAIRGIDILEGQNYVTEGGLACVTLFTETANAKTDANFLEQMLKGSTFLDSVEVLESHRGMIIDSLNFPLVTDYGERSILFSAESARETFQAAKGQYGRNATDLIYSLGYSHGKSVWSKLFAGLEKDKESVQESLAFFSAVGMGRVTLVRYKADANLLTVAVDGCFECEGLQAESPVSAFFVGVLAGSFTALFGRGMVANETKCIAMGAKKCEFEIGPEA